jgi:superfamily I DNA and/or RNA helicase
VCFVDEAGQTTAPDAAQPLASFKDSMLNAIYIGNHLQQPPVIVSENTNEDHGILKTSLLERHLHLSTAIKFFAQEIIRLRIQYRMHPNNSGFPRTYVYGGAFDDHPSVQSTHNNQYPIFSPTRI